MGFLPLPAVSTIGLVFTDVEGFAVSYPFVYALGAILLGVPVYLMNRKRMTQPPGPPPPVDAVSVASVGH